MKTRSFIIGWALVVLLAGACSVQAEIVRSYDFNHLGIGTILGQDTPAWTNYVPAVYRDVAVASALGADGSYSNVATSLSGNYTYSDHRDWLAPVSFTSTDTAITQSFQFYLNSQETYQGIHAGVSFDPPHQYYDYPAFGVDSISAANPVDRFYLRTSSGGIMSGDSVVDNHWYDVKLVMNFSVSGGQGTLYYRNLTLGETAWTQDGTLVDKSLDIPLTGGAYVVKGLFVRFGSGGGVPTDGYVDNFALDDPKVPEPGTLMLLASGLIGLLCYAWRKRK